MTRFRWYHNWQVYAQLPMKHTSVLPDEGFEAREVELTYDGDKFMVMCLPKSQQVGHWGHRVMVLCECNRQIPFGRMGQHYEKCLMKRALKLTV